MYLSYDLLYLRGKSVRDGCLPPGGYVTPYACNFVTLLKNIMPNIHVHSLSIIHMCFREQKTPLCIIRNTLYSYFIFEYHVPSQGKSIDPVLSC